MTKYRAEQRVLGMNPGDTIESYDPEDSPYLTALVEKGILSIVDEEETNGSQGLAPDSTPGGADLGVGEGADQGSGGGGERVQEQLASRHRTTA